MLAKGVRRAGHSVYFCRLGFLLAGMVIKKLLRLKRSGEYFTSILTPYNSLSDLQPFPDFFSFL